ncbi:MAG TPA: Smr/MutS family protein [Thermoanaerobaculia bacterium]|nr:Smr/MutS family protein [Thermoanaerobaculia bacterium]
MRRVPIEDSFDLHSFLPRDVASALDEYLREAREAGFTEVRIIHGKGIGVRRAEVRKLLGQRNEVLDFFDAPPERGGSGATVARLKADG